MNDTTEILTFIDGFLAQHSEWLPNVTLDFALDLRRMVESARVAELEVAA